VPEPTLVVGREHPGERGDVAGGREVEPAEAGPPAQLLETDRTIAGIAGRKVDPALGLLGLLVEVHAAERVLRAGQGGRLVGLAGEINLITGMPKFAPGFRNQFVGRRRAEACDDR
jgi:hypothetical protein